MDNNFYVDYSVARDRFMTDALQRSDINVEMKSAAETFFNTLSARKTYSNLSRRGPTLCMLLTLFLLGVLTVALIITCVTYRRMSNESSERYQKQLEDFNNWNANYPNSVPIGPAPENNRTAGNNATSNPTIPPTNFTSGANSTQNGQLPNSNPQPSNNGTNSTNQTANTTPPATPPPTQNPPPANNTNNGTAPPPANPSGSQAPPPNLPPQHHRLLYASSYPVTYPEYFANRDTVDINATGEPPLPNYDDYYYGSIWNGVANAAGVAAFIFGVNFLIILIVFGLYVSSQKQNYIQLSRQELVEIHAFCSRMNNRIIITPHHHRKRVCCCSWFWIMQFRFEVSYNEASRGHDVPDHEAAPAGYIEQRDDDELNVTGNDEFATNERENLAAFGGRTSHEKDLI